MATRHRLSKHFTVEEFDCHDGTRVSKRDYNGLRVPVQRLPRAAAREVRHGPHQLGLPHRELQPQDRRGEPVFHIYTIHDGNDQAADITCAKGGPRDWHRTLNTIRQRERGGKGGLGLYGSFVHVDIRDYKADWRG